MAHSIENEIRKVAKKATKTGSGRFTLGDLAAHFSAHRGFRGYFPAGCDFGTSKRAVYGLVRPFHGTLFVQDGYFADDFVLRVSACA